MCVCVLFASCIIRSCKECENHLQKIKEYFFTLHTEDCLAPLCVHMQN